MQIFGVYSAVRVAIVQRRNKSASEFAQDLPCEIHDLEFGLLRGVGEWSGLSITKAFNGELSSQNPNMVSSLF